MRKTLIQGLLLAILLINVAIVCGANWPQWRGPNGQGISEEKGLPTEWSSTKNVLWRAEIAGRGHSSPIVWGNRIFVTSSLDGDVEPGAKAVIHFDRGKEFRHPDSLGGDRRHVLKVLCIDRDSGKILWERIAYEGRVYDDRHKKSSYASATPITDGKYLYAFFGSEGLYCYDFKGNLIWKRNFGGIATFGMGFGTSPVLYRNKIILQCDEDNGEKSFIVAVDKATGKDLWKLPRKVQASWATPILVGTPNHMELITSGNEKIIAYDPATGKELWFCKGVDSNAIPTPVAADNMVIVSAGFPKKITMAIKLNRTGDLTGTDGIAWKYDKGTAYVPSPILYDGYLYLMTDKGILTCLEPGTGVVKYEGGRVPVPATFTASPVAFDGKILLTSEDGDTFVIKAGPTHEVLRTNSIGEPVYASLAISAGRLFIRSAKALYCIGRRG